MQTMPRSVTTQEKIDQLKQDSDIQKALDQASGAKENVSVSAGSKQKLFLGGYLLLLLLLSSCYYLLGLRLFHIGEAYVPFLQRLLIGAMAIVIAVGLAKTLDVSLVTRLGDDASQYNIRRVIKLLTALVIALIIISMLFANWYTAVVSLGLVSLILGFALQTPITSFIAWIYILIRTPYRVGDRVRIGDATGDVIDLGYLDTTLWEFGGEYLSTDHPTGRIIKFPNSHVLSSAVYNYSWPLFPYIWNEIKFYVAYESDLEFVSETMRRIADEEIGEVMRERVRTFRLLLSETPVDQVEVREHPSVVFRVSDNTWLEAIVRYLVEPKQAGRVKSKLVEKMLGAMNAAPDRVLFPRGPAK